MSCPNASNVKIVSLPEGVCFPVEGCPDGPPVEVTGPDGAPVDVTFPTPVAVTVADGADVCEGATTDAKVIDDNPGTISAKLRGLLRIFGPGTGGGPGVWNGLNPFGLPETFNISPIAAVVGTQDGLADSGIVQQIDAGIRAIYNVSPNLVWNGNSWDRLRNNELQAVLFSAVRAATTSSANVEGFNARGATIHFDITAIQAGQTLTLTVEAYDFLSGVYSTVFTSAGIVATGHSRFVIYPGVTPVANVAVSDVLDRIWRVTVTPTGAAGNSTYSVFAYSMV